MADIAASNWDQLVAAARSALNDAGERTVERAAWLGIVWRLRSAMAQLKRIAPGAVPLGFGAMSDVEVLNWWRADPITPIRQILGAPGVAFAGRPGIFEQLGGGIGDAFGLLWKVVIGVVVAIGSAVVVGVLVWAVRR